MITQRGHVRPKDIALSGDDHFCDAEAITQYFLKFVQAQNTPMYWVRKYQTNGEKCDVMLPWQQNIWITTIGSLSNNDGDGNENGKKSNKFR